MKYLTYVAGEHNQIKDPRVFDSFQEAKDYAKTQVVIRFDPIDYDSWSVTITNRHFFIVRIKEE